MIRSQKFLYWVRFSIDAISTKNDATGIEFRYSVSTAGTVFMNNTQESMIFVLKWRWQRGGMCWMDRKWSISMRIRISSKVSVEIFVWSLDCVQKITMNFRSLSLSYLKRINRNSSTLFSFLNRSNRQEKLLDISLTTSSSTSSSNTSAMNEDGL